jgi:hypothetical protein
MTKRAGKRCAAITMPGFFISLAIYEGARSMRLALSGREQAVPQDKSRAMRRAVGGRANA